MLCIKPKSLNPYFNIAAEEYFLKNFDDDVFMLWRNEPSIIVGKHQNTLGEVNHPYIREHDIKVVRRLSGGGTVFHDLGNVNFTFMRAGDNGKLVDFRKFTQPIIDVLQQMGAHAYHSGRNDLLLDGFKISGNAEHVYKNKVLHHGTLLFSSNIESLNEAIKVDLTSYNDKSVKSFRSKVTNILPYLNKEMVVEDFLDQVFEYICEAEENAQLYIPTEADISQINELVETKYSKWEWNYAYSPNYELKRKLENGTVSIEWEMSVQKGYVKSLAIKCTEPQYGQMLQDQLMGKALIYGEIEQLLIEINKEHLLSDSELMSLIF